MNNTTRNSLTSLGTLIVAGLLLAAMVTYGVNETENDKRFEELTEEALALSVLTQNMMQLTTECGADSKETAEGIVKETAALLEFDVDIRWSTQNKFKLVISQENQKKGLIGGKSVFTLTDDIVLDQPVRNPERCAALTGLSIGASDAR